MHNFSVIILCKNEAACIGKTLKALEGLTDDVVLYDTGSTDETLSIARAAGATIHNSNWLGFGKTRQLSLGAAKYDWIFSLDADELMDETLKESLLNLNINDVSTVYRVKRKNFIGDKEIKFGEWGNDFQNRLFNRTTVNWDDAEVHETLLITGGVKLKSLKGALLHQSMTDTADYANKMVKYATLGAEKYFRIGKKSSWIKRNLAPGFTFFKYYFIRLGLLDGAAGYLCAKMASHYTYLKYTMLRELESKIKIQ